MSEAKLLQFLKAPDGEKIAYKMNEGHGPAIIWCGGLKSDMGGSKAVHLHDWAMRREQTFIRFDYFGHGQSSGNFTDGTISRWAKDVSFVRDKLADEPVILIGSSMGGWASMLSAIWHPQNLKGLVLINPAPDFTEKLTAAKWTEEQIKQLEDDGVVYEPSGYDEPYAYSKTLMDDGRAHQILDATIPISCPIRILQGVDDPIVPWQHSHLILDNVTSQDVTYNLIKGGDHSLSRPQDLIHIEKAITDITSL